MCLRVNLWCWNPWFGVDAHGKIWDLKFAGAHYEFAFVLEYHDPPKTQIWIWNFVFLCMLIVQMLNH